MSIEQEYKDIKGVCNEIDLIINKKDNKNDYKYLFLDLENILYKREFSEIDVFCNTVLKIAKTKNRILRHLESHFWSFANSILYQLILKSKIETVENETIELNTDYDNPEKKILSKFRVNF